MANTNPDIELVVGVDSNNSYTAMKDGINQVIRDIESRDPPKIKIHLDDTEINSKLQSLRSQITALSENKISINITGATQGAEKTIKSAISNYEQAYDFIKNKMGDPIAESQLAEIKPLLEQNIGLANKFYEALSQSFAAIAPSQLISTFEDLCQKEADATQATREFGSVIQEQFMTSIPGLVQSTHDMYDYLDVIKKFDKASGKIGQYSGTDFFRWLTDSATKAQKALFDVEMGYEHIQGVLRGLDAHGNSFVHYSTTLDLDTLTIQQDAMRKLASVAKEARAEGNAYERELSNLRQALVSTFNISPQGHGDGTLYVTLQQLQQIVEQAPLAQKYIDRIVSSFSRPYQQIGSSMGNVETVEQSLQTQTERLGETMNNAITLDTFNSKLGTINESIGQVSGSISTLAENISSALGGKAGAGSTLNIDQEALKGLEELLRGIYDLVEHSDMSKLNGEMSEMGERVRTVATYLGRYREELSGAVTDRVHSSLTGLGIAEKDADVISKHLSDMHIKVKEVVPEVETIAGVGQRIKSITVQGKNELGDAVNHVIKFSAKTGEISRSLTKAKIKGKEFTQTVRELADGSKEINVETTVAELEEIDGLIKSIEKTNSTLNSSRNKVTDALGGLSTTGKNREELDAINKKFDELMVATERLKTNRMTANQEDVDGLRKIQEELDALIRKSQERLRIEAESKDLSSATSAEKNVSRIKEMLNTKDIDASVAKVIDRFEKLGNSGATGLDVIKQNIAQINTLLASLKSPRVLSNDNALLSTYQELSTLLETVSNRISIIESRTNTSKKINFGIDTEKFKTDIDVLQQKLNDLTNKTAPLYSTITKNMTDLQAAFKQMNDPAVTQDQRVAAYQRLNDLIPVVTKQIRAQATAEAAAANAAKKAKAEAVRGAKQQIAENEQANVQRKIAYQLIAQIAQAQKEWTKARNGSMSNEYSKLQSYSSQLTTLLNQLSSGTIGKSDFSAQVKNIGNEFVRTSSIIRTAGEDTKTLADRFGSLGSKFSIWFSTTRIIMMVYTNIRKMISASIELDKTMTQLQIVTKQNDDAMEKFGDSAAAAAKRIGSSITDFVSSATTYARLGYSLDESSRLAEFTAMLQNVGDIDVSEAQDAITSIVKAFNIGTDQIESVMDKMVVAGK